MELLHEDRLAYVSGSKDRIDCFGIGCIDAVECRLFSIKAQCVMDELTQITDFVKRLEEFWYGSPETVKQIRAIFLRLCPENENGTQTEAVNIVAKYLNGMRDFLSAGGMRDMAFYQKLFESAFAAITRELDSLDPIC